MEYSLEDDDFGDLFITQEGKSDGLIEQMDVEEEGVELFLGLNQDDFTFPIMSTHRDPALMYSDISEDEAFENSPKSIKR